MRDDENTRQFWSAYAAAAQLASTNYTVFRFGDNEMLADELAALVLAGKKRATSSLLRDFGAFSQPMPKPGDFGIVVDGHNAPQCVVRTTEVSVKQLGNVDEQFASEEGGGDRSLAWWRASHARYFRRQGARQGFNVDDSTEVVLVRFEVVWPPQYTREHAGWV